MWPDPLDESKRKPRRITGTYLNKVSHKVCTVGMCLFIAGIYAIGYFNNFILKTSSKFI